MTEEVYSLPREMTPEEKKVLDLTVELWNAYRELPPAHGSEMLECSQYVHQVQGLLALRCILKSK